MSNYDYELELERKRAAEAQYRGMQNSLLGLQKAVDSETVDQCAKRENAATLINRRARDLQTQSALYFWLASAIDRNPPDPGVEQELYNFVTRGPR